MIRVQSTRQHQPVYREVLKHAALSAWRDRRYWPLAFLSSALLTGSSYDIILSSVDTIARNSTSFANLHLSRFSASVQTMSGNGFNLFHALYALEAVTVIAVILLALIALSCMAQGGLIYALGASNRGKAPTLKEAFRIGGGAFWPIATVNVLALAVIYVLRFLVAFPLYLAVSQPSQSTWILYLLAFVLIVPLIFIVVIVQIFSLNAMILQGAPAAEAIVRSYTVFKKHWITILETAALLFILTICFGVLVSGLIFVCLIPLLVAILAAAFIQSPFLLTASLCIALLALIIGAFVAAAFITQLHYATWTFLYRKLGEGGVMPKIHRWIRTLLNTFTVPQS